MADRTYSFLYDDVSDLGKNSPINFQWIETIADMDWKQAILMAQTVQKNNEEGKQTMFILPVGPTGYASRFAWIVNRNRISLKDCIFINMDEYMWDEHTLIEPTNPISFKYFMNKDLYSKVDDDLNVLPENRVFPDPDNLGEIWERIQKKEGGVDICFGGIGIDGHIAFNEPQNDDLTPEQFAELRTRVLPIHYSTKVINSLEYNGNYEAMPDYCITIGMKEILSSQRLVFFTSARHWQNTLRHVIDGPVSSHWPGSLMQTHKDCTIYCLKPEVTSFF